MGDTDSSCFLTHTTNLTDARAVADEITLIVNNDYSRFVKETFFVQPDFSNYIECTREIIGSKGIFVAKKHYIVQIADKEGKTVDEQKVMGITLKKTVLPKQIRNSCLKFIERYLKNEPWESIAPDVVQLKNKLNTAPVLQLGIPSGINNLERYTADYERNSKARLPGHVAASILWNKCLDRFNDKESVKIISGSRVKKYAVASKIFGKFTSIAIPNDMVKIPDWFTSAIVLDKGKQIEKLVDKPLMEVMEAAGCKMPSSGSLAIEGLLEM